MLKTGEKHSSHRLLRSVKNRFGSTDEACFSYSTCGSELGVFDMSESGLQAVSNPSQMFLSEVHSESELLAGLAVAVIMDGSRTFLIEIQGKESIDVIKMVVTHRYSFKPEALMQFYLQALYVPDSSGRHYNGVPTSRADMIISVLKKQAGLKMQDSSVFLNVVSGVSLTETSGDLAVAAAICSRHVLFLLVYLSSFAFSYLELPIPNHVAFIGEIGLGGELRMVPRIEKRVINLAKLGYKLCIVPKLAEKALAALNLEGLQVVGCNNLKVVIDEVFRK
ncbi:DNA repair protein RadA [Bienertia sinuspersici]